MVLKVSVVVPVYNPGPHIDVLIDSLARQTLPFEEWEVIFVDDGSTDGTGERLDGIIATLPNARVIHIPASGWPGRPRNVGIDAATGEYIHLMDNDDALGEDALRRLYEYATAHRSDVVIGREVRRGMRLSPHLLFAKNRPNATLADDPLLNTLNPHKMFRRQFLNDHGIRCLEGKRRLDDNALMMTCYFAADVISVLSDYTCYYWIMRPDGSNAGRRQDNWPRYWRGVSDALDIVERNVAPGPERDRLLCHWYGGNCLSQLGPHYAGLEPAEREVLYGSLREHVLERYSPALDALLDPSNRLRAALLRADREPDLLALAEAQRGLRLQAEVHDLEPGDGYVDLTVAAEIHYRDGSPLRFDRDGERRSWKLPTELSADIDPGLLDFTEHLGRTSLEMAVWDPATGEGFPLPLQRLVAIPDDSLRAVGTFRLDPSTVAFGALRPGRWEFNIQLKSCGWRPLRKLPASSLPTAAIRAAEHFLLVNGHRDATVARNGVKRGRLISAVTPQPDGARIEDGPHPALTVPLRAPRIGGAPVRVRLALRRADGHSYRVPARLVPAAGGSTLRADLSLHGADAIEPGSYQLRIVSPTGQQPLDHLVHVGAGTARLETRSGPASGRGRGTARWDRRLAGFARKVLSAAGPRGRGG
jgi:hypothetical protein